MIAAISLAAIIATADAGPFAKSRHNDLLCLAANVYHEARGEPLDGQIAVAYVTRNRVEDGRWPGGYCAVVWQRMQFTWTHQLKTLRRSKLEEEAWGAAVGVAVLVMADMVADPTEGATHYCDSARATAKWCRKAEPIVEIGNHKFAMVD